MYGAISNARNRELLSFEEDVEEEQENIEPGRRFGATRRFRLQQDGGRGARLLGMAISR